MSPKLFLILLISIKLSAQDSVQVPKIEWDGYARLLGNFSQVDQQAFGPLGKLFPASYQDYQIHQRLNARYQPNTHWYFELGLRNRLFWGYQQKNFPSSFDGLDSDMGMLDLSWTIWNDQTAFVSLIDRFYGRWTNKHWDIRLGRQRINWGKNSVWNPNDIFNQYNYLDFDYEERRGSDAILIEYFFSGFKSVELAYSPGRNDDFGVGAARFNFPLGIYDLQLISGLYHDDWIWGAGWAGSIRGLGFKGEFTQYIPLVESSSENWLLAPSIDYLTAQQIYLQLGYLYNDQGSTRTLELLRVSSGNVLEAKNLFPFQSSLFGQVSYPFHPLWTVNLSGIATTAGEAAIIIPSIGYNWKQNIDFLLLSQIFAGQAWNDEFGYLSSSIFIRMSYSF
jgi:hypothetical protein